MSFNARSADISFDGIGLGMGGRMFSNLMIINLILGAVLPAVVAFVTSAKAPAQVKTVTLLGLAAAGSVLTTISQKGAFDQNWRVYVGSFAVLFFTGVGTHFGALKPLKLTGADGAVAGTGLSVGAPSETPVQTDNSVRPEDGSQELVSQDSQPVEGSPTDDGAA